MKKYDMILWGMKVYTKEMFPDCFPDNFVTELNVIEDDIELEELEVFRVSSYEPYVILGDFLIILIYSEKCLLGGRMEHVMGFMLYYVGLFGRAGAAVLLMELFFGKGVVSWFDISNTYRTSLLIMVEVILLIYVWIILRLKRHIVLVLGRWTLFIYVAFPCVIFALLFRLVDIVMCEDISQNSKISIIMMVVMVTVLMVALFYFAVNGMKNKSEREKNAALLKIIDTEKERNQQLYESRQEVIRFKHDIVNKMLALKYLVDTDQGEEAGNELQHIIEDVSGEKRKFVKGHSLWDLIIESRIEKAEKSHISITKNIYPGNYQRISETDLALIIGNLFDNALEAQEKVKEGERSISFCMKEKWGCVYIAMCNSAEIKPELFKEETTKADRLYHGWGLRSVREIVQKHQGTIYVEPSENNFAVRIIMQIEK